MAVALVELTSLIEIKTKLSGAVLNLYSVVCACGARACIRLGCNLAMPYGRAGQPTALR